MKGKHPYRTTLHNFSHQLEHVGPNKQISEVQAHRICYLAPCTLNPWSPRLFKIWSRYKPENIYTHKPQV